LPFNKQNSIGSDLRMRRGRDEPNCRPTLPPVSVDDLPHVFGHARGMAQSEPKVTSTIKPDGRPPALAERPRPLTENIERVLKWVHDGRIRIPSFQRPLEWTVEDALLLLDSMYRGYPVGTLLFWQRNAEAATVRLGPLTFPAMRRTDAYWVVDGQQRLTWLAISLLAGRAGDRAFLFDPTRTEFRVARRGEAVAPPAVPLEVVLDSERLIGWLLDRGEYNWRSEVIALGKRLREYELAGYVVESDDEAVMREVFARLNRHGKALQQSRVFDALHGRTERAAGSLDAIADSLRTSGFGRVRSELAYKVLLAIQGVDVTRGQTYRPADDEAAGAYDATLKAMRRAIAFLQSDAAIPRIELLPYKMTLVALSLFFHKHPEPSPRSRDLLSRWLWQGAASERHQGNTVATRQSLVAIGGDEESAVQALLADTRQRPAEIDTKDPFAFRFARGKILALALLELGPRDLDTGERINLPQLFDRKDPKRWTLPRIVAERHRSDLGKSVANVVLHPPVALLRQKLLAAPAEVLASHCIFEEATADLRAGNKVSFLRRRDRDVAAQATAFLHRRARWGETDRPSLAYLRVVDDD